MLFQNNITSVIVSDARTTNILFSPMNASAIQMYTRYLIIILKDLQNDFSTITNN